MRLHPNDEGEIAVYTATNDQQRVAVAWDEGSGEYALVWQHGSANQDLYARFLDRNGAFVGQVETIAAADNAQTVPALAYDADRGRFLAVWTDYRNSATGPDVYGQLFAGNLWYSVTVDYRYDRLYRLVEASYSDGTSYGYAFDAAGHRTALTSVTALSGTVVTTYDWDAAGRLEARDVSDGRSYTYTWSLRGEMTAEWTQGAAVRTFSWDDAGRMVSATLFTQTTHFTYAGDGTRLALGVEGHGLTRFVPDYAGRGRVLFEQTGVSTTLYLYGWGCLAERREGELLYYHEDGEGLVRQVTGEAGRVEDAWVYDPDGTVVAGSEGPISHLVCGGVYDWSTGLIYRDGRYFDPTLGIWLALAPLVVLYSWKGRKKKGRRLPWWVVALLLVGVGGGLVGCGPGQARPAPAVCAETEIIPFGPPLEDNVVFLSPRLNTTLPNFPHAKPWTENEMTIVEGRLTDVIENHFGGSDGFGSPWAALAALRISNDAPIHLLRETSAGGVTASCWRPRITVFDRFFTYDAYGQAWQLGHEVAHYWDQGYGHWDEQGGDISREMKNWVTQGVEATHYGSTDPVEDLPELVRIYFWPAYDEGRVWTDNRGRGETLRQAGEDPPEGHPPFPWDRDRYDWLVLRFQGG